MKTNILLLLAFCLLSGCAQKVTSERLNLEQSYAPVQNNEPLSQSLFNFKDRTISEADIQKILNSPVELPDTIRIALLNYASSSTYRYNYNYWNNEDYLKLQQEYIDILERSLAANNRVSKIILMPKLLMGASPNIFTLREAAVRLQADVLFIFSINSDLYYDYKVFKKNEVKAFATCESLLMDIRTGIIPYADVVSRDTLVKKINEDMNDNTFRKRAESDAVRLTLTEIGQGLHNYLK